MKMEKNVQILSNMTNYTFLFERFWRTNFTLLAVEIRGSDGIHKFSNFWTLSWVKETISSGFQITFNFQDTIDYYNANEMLLYTENC